jgi:hypothetical protein
MRLVKQVMIVIVFASLTLGAPKSDAQSRNGAAPLLASQEGAGPAVTPPPDSFFEKVRERDRDAAREALKQYDAGLFTLADETMAYKGKADWRCRQ